MMDADRRAIDYARQHLDLSSNLNDQGYFGPFPNEADPRTIRRAGDDRPSTVEYYEWVERWCEAHDYRFDNKRMLIDRREYLTQKYPEWDGSAVW
jgi:endo-alpha-1,4-polygalactosaminidase (GH114 family)